MAIRAGRRHLGAASRRPSTLHSIISEERIQNARKRFPSGIPLKFWEMARNRNWLETMRNRTIVEVETLREQIGEKQAHSSKHDKEQELNELRHQLRWIKFLLGE